MRKELEQKLVKRFPTWFNSNGDAPPTQPPVGFECGDGWHEILWRLCVDLEPIVAELEKETGEQFEVVQVKKKLGTLGFYVNHHSDAINERIVEAQNESSRTCEICGQPGKWLEGSGWVQTRCEEHAQRPEGL
jgi:hypothetical protein